MAQSPDKATKVEFSYHVKRMLEKLGITPTLVTGMPPNMVKKFRAKLGRTETKGLQAAKDSDGLYIGDVKEVNLTPAEIDNSDLERQTKELRAKLGVTGVQELELEQDDDGLYTGKIK